MHDEWNRRVIGVKVKPTLRHHQAQDVDALDESFSESKAAAILDHHDTMAPWHGMLPWHDAYQSNRQNKWHRTIA